MDCKASAFVVVLLVVACDGYEMRRIMIGEGRQPAFRRTATERQYAMSRLAQDGSYFPIGGGSDDVGRTGNLPAGSRYCENNSEYGCHPQGTCIVYTDGSWSCQYSEVSSYTSSLTRPRYGNSQMIRIPFPSNRMQTTRYYQRWPMMNYGPISRIYSRYTCNTGLERVNITENAFKCVDIDECDTQANQCSQTCVNTFGSFYCTCETGYKREGVTECVDVDECEESPRACSSGATCLNTEGSFECECHEGYRRSEVDSRLCDEINECVEDNPCHVSEICFNTFGSYQCDEPMECPEGYTRADAAGSSEQECTREEPESDDPDSPDFITYMKIGAEATESLRKHLGSLQFAGASPGYNHEFSVRVLNGSDYFMNRRSGFLHGFFTNPNTLQLDIYNLKPLEAGESNTYTLLITHRMVPRFMWYYDDETRTTKRKVVVEIVPMSHDT